MKEYLPLPDGCIRSEGGKKPYTAKGDEPQCRYPANQQSYAAENDMRVKIDIPQGVIQ